MVEPLVSPRHNTTPSEARARVALLTIQHERFCFLRLLRGVSFEHDASLETLTKLWVDQ